MSIREDEEFSDIIEGDKLIIDAEIKTEVDFREPFGFEEQQLISLTDPDRGNSGAALAVKGRWIHGWLQEKGEDYINNIHKNWLFFTEYVRIRTKNFINTSEYNIRQGKYQATYRYLLILEELGVIERFKVEEVAQEEYDHFVPDNMRARTFIRIVESIDENPDAWLQPHNTLFPDGEKDEEASIRDTQLDDIDVEPADPQEPTVDDLPDVDEEVEEPDETEATIDDIPTIDEEVEDVPEGDGEERTIDDLPDIDDQEPEDESVEIEEGDEQRVPDEVEDRDGMNITDIEQRDRFTEIMINDYFSEAIRVSFEESDITPPDTEPEDFSFGRAGVFGVWADGTAERGDGITIMLSIDGSAADTNPPFLTSLARRKMDEFMNNDPRIEDIFSEVTFATSFDEVFRQQIGDLVRNEQETEAYFDLVDDEYKFV